MGRRTPTVSEPTSFCPALPCASCDAWLGLVGKRVLTVTDHEDVLVVTMESVADVTGWPRWGGDRLRASARHGDVDRRSLVRARGALGVAQTPLRVSRRRLRHDHVRRTGRHGRCAPGPAHSAGCELVPGPVTRRTESPRPRDQPQGEAPPGYAQLGASAMAQQPLARPSQS